MTKVMKRWLALALVAVLAVTSIGLSNIANADEVDPNALVISDGEIIASNYDDLTDEEKAVLKQAAIAGTIHRISKPSAEDELTAVDSTAKVIYAKNYKIGGYTWYAETATIVVDEEEKETVTLVAGDCSYDGTNYDAQAAFTYAGDGYAVEVTYKVYLEDANGELKEAYVNLPYYMAEVYNAMASANSKVSTLNMVMEEMAEVLKPYVNLGVIPENTNAGAAILSWVQQVEDNNGKSDWHVLTKGDADWAYTKASEKLENILAHGETYKECIEKTYTELLAITTSQTIIDNVDADLLDMLTPVVESFKAAADADWTFITLKDALNTDMDTSGLDALVAAVETNEANQMATIEKLYVGSEVISCNVNRYNVTVNVVINAVDSSNTVNTVHSNNTVINLASDVLKADVIAAIEATGFEGTQVDIANALAAYNVALDHYNREVSTSLGDTLTEDVTYTITYSPKTYTVDYTDEALEDLVVPYGTSIVFPKNSSDDESYEYTIEGVIYEEGTTYKVVKDLVVSRELTKSKTPFREYDVVVDNYASILTGDEAAILKNLAIFSNTFYVRTADDLVTLDDANTKVTAQSYNAGNGMTWVPYAVYVKNNDTVVETVTTFNDGVAYFTTNEYTNVDVEYRLVVAGVTNDEVIEALNLPYELVTEVKQILADLNALKGYEDSLKQVTAGVLDLVRSKLNAASQTAIDVILANCIADNGTDMLLTAYIAEYKALKTDAERLNWYFANNKYGALKSQVTLLADNVAVIVNDPALPEVLESLNQAALIEKLEGVSEDLEALRSKFPAKNDKINTESGQYGDLIDLLVVAKDVKRHDSATVNGLYLTQTFGKVAATRSEVKVVIKVVGSDGVVVQTITTSDTCLKEAGLNQAQLDKLVAAVEGFEEGFADKKFYKVTVEGELPSVGEALDSDVTVTYTWSPKTYTVKIDGEENQTFASDIRKIFLPGTSDASVKYYYVIGDKRIEVTGVNYEYTFTKAELEALFVGETLTIVREEISIAKENLQNLVTSLNASLVQSGQAKEASFVLIEDANGNLSIVLRLNPSASVATALQEVVMGLASQTYVNIGGNVIIQSGIHVNGLVQLLLNSGISSTQLEAMIDDNGNIVNNVTVATTYALRRNGVTLNGTVVDGAVAGVPAVDQLGGLLMETTFSINSSDPNGVPMYITLQDFGASADTLKSLDSYLKTAAPYVYFELANGAVNVELTTPEKIHEAFMAFMLLEGKVTLEEFETLTFAEMVEFAKEFIIDPVLLNEEVTAETIINTGDKAGQDLAAYFGYITTALKAVRGLADGALANAELEEVTGTLAADEYKLLFSCPTSKVVSVAGLPAGIAELLIGDIYVPINMEYTNCNADYNAIIGDAGQSEYQDMLDMTQNAHITTQNNYTVIVLTDDVESIVANATTLIDLNGYKVTTLIANANVVVIDSRLGSNVAGTIQNIGGTGNVTITAGVYTQDVTSYIPVGYVQENGKVYNKYYRLTQDSLGNISIEISADILKLDTNASLKALALEIATDLALNMYTWAGTTVVANVNGSIEQLPIYGVELIDLIGLYTDYTKEGYKTFIDDFLAMVDCDGIETFVNDILDKLTDYVAIGDAIASDGPIVEYGLITNAWKVEIAKAAGNYLTANIVTGEAKTYNVELVIVGEDEDKKDLEALSDELAEIYGQTGIGEGVLDLNFRFDTLAYDKVNGFDVSAGFDATVVADLSNKDYAAVIGVILANGMSNPDKMVAAVNKYIDEGKVADLVKEIENVPVSQILTSLEKANGVSFKTMMNKLDISASRRTVAELAEVYEDALQIAYSVFARLDLGGNGRTLASLSTGEYATYGAAKSAYGVSVDFTLILADEDPFVPEETESETTTETESETTTESESETTTESESESESESDSGQTPGGGDAGDDDDNIKDEGDSYTWIFMLMAMAIGICMVFAGYKKKSSK